MVDEQPQVELRAGQRRRRQCFETLRQRGPSDVERVDGSDLPRSRLERRVPAIRCVGIRNTRSPRPIKKRSSEPETWRQSSSAQTRSPARLRAQVNSAAKPRRPTRDRLLAEQLAGSASDRRDRVRALVSVRAEHDHGSRPHPLMLCGGGRPVDTACWGRCHASYQVTPNIPDRRRATKQKEVRPDGPTASKRVSSPPGRDHLHRVGRHRRRIETASLEAAAGVTGGAGPPA